MKIETYYCDRCGKELERGYNRSKIAYPVRKSKILFVKPRDAIDTKAIEVCEKCFNSFKNWVDDANK